MPAAAIIGASVIGAGASLAAGSSAAGAQRDAAAQDAQLQREQTAEARRQYDQNRADLAPYRSVGTGSLYKLSNLMGITPVQERAPASTTGTGFVPSFGAVFNGQGFTLPQFPTQPAAPSPSVTANQNPAEFGALDRPFTLADFTKDPGYDFRMSEGQKAVDNSAAARGGVLSGGAMKAMARYGQDFASNEYGAAYNRFNNDQTTRFNRLSALAGTGQTATNSGIAAGNNLIEQQQQGVNNIMSANNAAANATASQYAGIGNTIANTANNVGGYFAMKNLYGGGGSSIPTTTGGYGGPIVVNRGTNAGIGI